MSPSLNTETLIGEQLVVSTLSKTKVLVDLVGLSQLLLPLKVATALVVEVFINYPNNN